MFHAHRGSRVLSEQLVLLWQHECARVFQDRIADQATREWFNKTIHNVRQCYQDLRTLATM